MATSARALPSTNAIISGVLVTLLALFAWEQLKKAGIL